MKLRDVIPDHNHEIIHAVAHKAGITEQEATSVVDKVLPAILSGIQRETKAEDQFKIFSKDIESHHFDQYLDHPDEVESKKAEDEGNQILENIFKTKEVSRNVADKVAQKTGVAGNAVKKVLPMIATLVMGSLTRSGKTEGLGGISSTIKQLLDRDHDGEVWDDVFDFAASLFSKKKH